MNLLKNPTSVKMLASEIVKACDDYVGKRVSEKQLKELIWHYASVHGVKLFSALEENGFNPTIASRIGQKRLTLVKIILDGFQLRL